MISSFLWCRGATTSTTRFRERGELLARGGGLGVVRPVTSTTVEVYYRTRGRRQWLAKKRAVCRGPSREDARTEGASARPSAGRHTAVHHRGAGRRGGIRAPSRSCCGGVLVRAKGPASAPARSIAYLVRERRDGPGVVHAADGGDRVRTGARSTWVGRGRRGEGRDAREEGTGRAGFYSSEWDRLTLRLRAP